MLAKEERGQASAVKRRLNSLFRKDVPDDVRALQRRLQQTLPGEVDNFTVATFCTLAFFQLYCGILLELGHVSVGCCRVLAGWGRRRRRRQGARQASVLCVACCFSLLHYVLLQVI